MDSFKVINAQALPLCSNGTSGVVSKKAMKEDSLSLCFQDALIMPFSQRYGVSPTALHSFPFMHINER